MKTQNWFGPFLFSWHLILVLKIGTLFSPTYLCMIRPKALVQFYVLTTFKEGEHRTCLGDYIFNLFREENIWSEQWRGMPNPKGFELFNKYQSETCWTSKVWRKENENVAKNVSEINTYQRDVILNKPNENCNFLFIFLCWFFCSMLRLFRKVKLNGEERLV